MLLQYFFLLNYVSSCYCRYFETFDVVSELEVEERVKMMDMMAKCASQDERDRLKKKTSVDAPRFFLFLFLQNAPRHSLKASLITGDE
jgi:hypothetical protein